MCRRRSPKIICLSNVFDQQYQSLRGEPVAPSLSSNKRRDLFRCLEMAAGREVLVLSSPPKAVSRRIPKWLPPVTTRFSTHTQLFCCNWDAPKLRIPLSWCFYAIHVLKNVRSGDVVVIDNFEFLYVVAARMLNVFKKVHFVLEYEDGKHLIDRSWSRVLSNAAERLGKGLIKAAVLAHPSLGQRLPLAVPCEVVPGFVVSPSKTGEIKTQVIRFLYSGTLDTARGLELLLSALAFLPPAGWCLEISGTGPLESLVIAAATDPRWGGKVCFHGALPSAEYKALIGRCHVGLNCQRVSDPISEVTFPSKLFTYLSAGLLIISSKASKVADVLGDACLYLDDETPESLARVMTKVMTDFDSQRAVVDTHPAVKRYSIEGTALRLKQLLPSSLQ